MATNYKIADRLDELKIELARRKKAGSPNFIRKPKEEAETVEEDTIQSSSYHDWLHAQVADLAENGIRISAKAETVTLQGPDGTLLAQGVVPEPDYNDPARSDPFDTFFNSGALRYLQTALESLGCAPQPVSGRPAALRGTFKGRTII